MTVELVRFEVDEVAHAEHLAEEYLAPWCEQCGALAYRRMYQEIVYRWAKRRTSAKGEQDDRFCEGQGWKVKYLSWSAANRCATELFLATRNKLNRPYPCDYGRHWHLTSSPPRPEPWKGEPVWVLPQRFGEHRILVHCGPPATRPGISLTFYHERAGVQLTSGLGEVGSAA